MHNARLGKGERGAAAPSSWRSRADGVFPIPPFFAHIVWRGTFIPTSQTSPPVNHLSSPMAARSSDIPATRIPKITDLRDRLNYGNSRLSRYSAFSDDLRVFRRKFVSKDLTGEDLWDWKSSEHQAALNAMTHAFLENHGYGELYWPSDPTSPNFNSLQYSKHRAL
jgi:hypothetical protein